MTDLRTLAQSVVRLREEAARTPFHAAVDIDADEAATELGCALGFPRGCDAPEWVARAILAALAAERAQGYALAMGEVVAEAEHDEALRAAPGPHPNAVRTLQNIADWARERLPAAAEKEHGG